MKKISAKAKKVVDICNNNPKVKNAINELFDAIKQSKQKITKIEKSSFSDVVINVAAKIESSNLLKI